MGLNKPETDTGAVRGPGADAVERLSQLAQNRRQGFALAMGLTGLGAAVLIALFGR